MLICKLVHAGNQVRLSLSLSLLNSVSLECLQLKHLIFPHMQVLIASVGSPQDCDPACVSRTQTLSSMKEQCVSMHPLLTTVEHQQPPSLELLPVSWDWQDSMALLSLSFSLWLSRWCWPWRLDQITSPLRDRFGLMRWLEACLPMYSYGLSSMAWYMYIESQLHRFFPNHSICE